MNLKEEQIEILKKYNINYDVKNVKELLIIFLLINFTNFS